MQKPQAGPCLTHSRSKREASVAGAECARARAAGGEVRVSQGVEIGLRSALKWHYRKVWGQSSDSWVVNAALWPLCGEWIINGEGQDPEGWGGGPCSMTGRRAWLGPGAELCRWRGGLDPG